MEEERINIMNEKQTVNNIELPSVKELLEAGVHFGHATKRWNPKMGKYIYTKRGGVHIIDLAKTLDSLKYTLDFLKRAAVRGDILIVGTKRQAYDLVEEVALRSGSHFVNNRWAGGLLTNHKVVRKSLKKLKDLETQLASGVENRTKQEIAWMKKDYERLSRLYRGVKHLTSKPTAVVVIDAKREHIAVREANKAGIPVIALADTNTDPDLIDYIVPGNDDAVSSIEIMLNLFANVILEGNEGKRLQSIRKTYDAELERLKEESKVTREKAKMKEDEKLQERLAMKKGEKIVRIVEPSSKSEEPKVKARTRISSRQQAKVEEGLESLGLSSRTLKALKAANLDLADLRGMSSGDLGKIKGIGPKSVDEIVTLISK